LLGGGVSRHAGWNYATIKKKEKEEVKQHVIEHYWMFVAERKGTPEEGTYFGPYIFWY
jgi:hypothetical protein